MSERTHDYTVRTWSHDYGINLVEDGGARISVYGWGRGITTGDYLLLPNGEASTRYEVAHITYQQDPPDMWFADLQFAPRTEVQS